MLNIVLVEPEIPPNTGNIARTCAATGTALHLVEPLGFSIDDAHLKRAGLDYWPFVKLVIHKSLEDFLNLYPNRPMYFATTKGQRLYTDIVFEEDCFIVFGRETKGLPPELIEANAGKTLRIPMGEDTRLRSLNLSNSVSIILYEALRQTGFKGLY